jgi:hypothetical protein
MPRMLASRIVSFKIFLYLLIGYSSDADPSIPLSNKNWDKTNKGLTKNNSCSGFHLK